MEDPNITNMGAYYSRQYSNEDMQEIVDAQRVGDIMAMTGVEAINQAPHPSMFGGNTLDEIILQNNKQIYRQRSGHLRYGPDQGEQNTDLPRSMMMEFGSGSNNEFNFDPINAGEMNGHMQSVSGDQNGSLRGTRPSDLTLSTQFSDMSAVPYNVIASPASFHSPIHSSSAIGLTPSPYNPAPTSSGLPDTLLMNYPPVQVSPADGQLGLYEQQTYQNPFSGVGAISQMLPNFSRTLNATEEPPTDDDSSNEGANENGNRANSAENPQAIPRNMARSGAILQATATANAFIGPPPPRKNFSNASALQQPTWAYHGAYSSSGFDMLDILMRVAARPNPQINLGAVDMSCAFVVCDVTQHDIPIVYCSDIFERLTGYTRHEILGRNCRFLQDPAGKVQPGVKRSSCDDKTVHYFKNKIAAREEAQDSIVNYRKGGQPFVNLLTMIPITYDSADIKYYIGFQVDLVEQPDSVTNKNPLGSYAMNYQRGLLPNYVFQPRDTRQSLELGQSVARDDVSAVLSTITKGESEFTKRIWDKILLENTDDVVHVLSLKGLFLYLSPSCRKILEYDSSELVGTALSSVCHPSDIVPVTRELKDTTAGASVNVVYRIRRKRSGYMWFESHGSLHTEQGKGRKCIILVGRERPVYALSRIEINSVGGFGDNELWTKISTSGMFLFVSSNVKIMLDRYPNELMGTSIQSLMRSESKIEFGKLLELARTGKRGQLKHEMRNKRGQLSQVYTTLYSGDAAEGLKPTFLIAQTKFIKISRSNPSSTSRNSHGSPRTDLASAGSTPSTQKSGSSKQGGSNGNSVPQPSRSPRVYENVTTQPGGSGLPIGSQDIALASDENVFEELKTTRSTSWQFELRQMERSNRLLSDELQGLIHARKKRRRRKYADNTERHCANCQTRATPEWRRGPGGTRELCNSCGLRWAKQNGRISPRTGSHHSQSDKFGKSRSSSIAVNGRSPEQSVSTKAQKSQANKKQQVEVAQQPPKSPSASFEPHNNVGSVGNGSGNDANNNHSNINKIVEGLEPHE